MLQASAEDAADQAEEAVTGRPIPSLPRARGLHVKAAHYGTPEEAAEARRVLLASRLKFWILKALNESPGLALTPDEVGELSGLLLGRLDPPELHHPPSP